MGGGVRHLVQDLRAHAHEVPDHIGRLMRAAAAELEGGAGAADFRPQPPPFLAPGDAPMMAGKHQRPLKVVAK